MQSQWPEGLLADDAAALKPMLQDNSFANKGPVQGMHEVSQIHSSFPRQDMAQLNLLCGIQKNLTRLNLQGDLKTYDASMHSRVFSAKHQGKTFFDGISFIIQYTPKANHNDILIFAKVRSISPNPKRMVSSTWRNFRYLSFDIFHVVPEASDLPIRDVWPEVAVHQPWNDLIRRYIWHCPQLIGCSHPEPWVHETNVVSSYFMPKIIKVENDDIIPRSLGLSSHPSLPYSQRGTSTWLIGALFDSKLIIRKV